MDPAAYLSQGRFHRSIQCPRTNVKVTFALVGAWSEKENRIGGHGSGGDCSDSNDDGNDRSVVLYVLPSGCSRYTGILQDGIAAAKGVRMIAIDRPGAGGTPPCIDTERIRIATEQTLSVLEYMRVEKATIFAHSAGWLYTLALLTTAPSHLFTPLRAVISSPFVPTHASGSALSMLPKGVVSMAPTAFGMLGSLVKAVTWSSGLAAPVWESFHSKQDIDEPANAAQREAKRQRNKRNKPNARFHPPFTPHTKYGLDAWKAAAAQAAASASPRHPQTGRPVTAGDMLLFDCFVAEKCIHAVVEDFLLCLGKIKGLDSLALDAWTRTKLDEVASKAHGDMVILWGEYDGLIPKKGRTYLNAMVKETLAKHNDSITVQEWTIADGGHDTALTTAEVMDSVLDYLWPDAKPLT